MLEGLTSNPCLLHAADPSRKTPRKTHLFSLDGCSAKSLLNITKTIKDAKRDVASLSAWIPGFISPFHSNSPLMSLLCRLQMIQTRVESTAVIFPVLPVTFYSFTLSKSEAKDNWHRWEGGGENLPRSQRAVYFKFHKWRRLKGAFEEVLHIIPMLRIGLPTAEEDELEVLLATHNHIQRVDTEHAWIRAGVSGNNWLFSLFSCDNVDLDGMEYPIHTFNSSLPGEFWGKQSFN